MTDVVVAKTADRRVLGVMNELAFQADVRIGHGFDAADLVELSVDVGHVLLTPLFKEGGGHGSLERTLLALVNTKPSSGSAGLAGGVGVVEEL